MSVARERLRELVDQVTDDEADILMWMAQEMRSHRGSRSKANRKAGQNVVLFQPVPGPRSNLGDLVGKVTLDPDYDLIALRRSRV